MYSVWLLKHAGSEHSRSLFVSLYRVGGMSAGPLFAVLGQTGQQPLGFAPALGQRWVPAAQNAAPSTDLRRWNERWLSNIPPCTSSGRRERPLALHELVEDGQHLTGNVQLLTKLDPVIVFPSNKNI